MWTLLFTCLNWMLFGWEAAHGEVLVAVVQALCAVFCTAYVLNELEKGGSA